MYVCVCVLNCICVHACACVCRVVTKRMQHVYVCVCVCVCVRAHTHTQTRALFKFRLGHVVLTSVAIPDERELLQEMYWGINKSLTTKKCRLYTSRSRGVRRGGYLVKQVELELF